jgi:hypothetical protein
VGVNSIQCEQNSSMSEKVHLDYYYYYYYYSGHQKKENEKVGKERCIQDFGREA